MVHRKFFRKPSRAITADANVRSYAVRAEGRKKGKRTIVHIEARRFFRLFALRYAIMRLTFDRAAETREKRVVGHVKRAVKLAPHNARLLKDLEWNAAITTTR